MNQKNQDILILIPHGGYNVPEELKDYTILEKHEIFLEADTGAIELFSFPDTRAHYLHTDISRLFIDLNRPYTALKSNSQSVMNKMTSRNKDIFLPDHFPDEIALANILKRHYFPFHETAEKIINTGRIKLILDCHTVSASAPSSGAPRPLFTVQNRLLKEGPETPCAPIELAERFIELLKKKFSREKGTVCTRFSLNHPLFESYIMDRYCTSGTPILKLSVSRSLFLNEQHFNFDYLKIDEIRLKTLRDRLWECIETIADCIE